MKTAVRILMLVMLCGLALGYLYQHNCSLRLTRQLSNLEKERRLLAEELDSIDIEIARLSCFGRLESLWIAELPAAAPIDEVGRAGQVEDVAVAQYAGGR